nr:hypothetical protein [uncultured Campylobacter sp.]
MRKPYKNPNSNACFAAAGFCAEKFRKRSIKFYPYGEEPGAHDTAEFAAKGEKFCGAKRRGASA